MSTPQRIRFRLALTAKAYLHYYQGHARAVIVQAEDGRRVQIPAQSLRRFVSTEGIYGRFEMLLDANNKLISLNQLSQ